MTTQYVMRAYNTASSNHVYWAVLGAPDYTGTQSGYNPADLTSIIVDYSFQVPINGEGGISATGLVGGDLTGTLPDPSVVQIRGEPVSATTPTNQEALVYNGSSYTPMGIAPVFNVKSYGATGNGITDDAPAINVASAAATAAGGLLYFPPGLTYAIGSTINIECNVLGTGAKLITTGAMNIGAPACTAVLIGNSAAFTNALKINLPMVTDGYKTSVGWVNNQRVGVECRNLVDCEVHFGPVWNFTIGLYFTGVSPGQAHQNCQYYIQQLVNNKVNLQIQPEKVLYNSGLDGYGWCNECIFYGGDYQFGSEEGVKTAGCIQVLIADGYSGANGHKFIGPDLEGTTPQYQIQCYGAYNIFMHARFEDNAIPTVNYTNTAYAVGGVAENNIIWYGYESDQIQITGNGYGNTVIGQNTWKWEGGLPEGTFMLSNGYSNGSPAITIMPAGGWIGNYYANNDPLTDYFMTLSGTGANFRHGGGVDGYDRIQIDMNNSTLWFGLGYTYEPLSRVGIDPASGFINVYGIYGTLIAGNTGGTLGFYNGTAPVTQQNRAGQLTNSSGGSGSNTIGAVSGTGDDTAINNNNASLTARINALELIIHNLGLSK